MNVYKAPITAPASARIRTEDSRALVEPDILWEWMANPVMVRLIYYFSQKYSIYLLFVTGKDYKHYVRYSINVLRPHCLIVNFLLYKALHNHVPSYIYDIVTKFRPRR